jgi:uncharacterized damage-inducible protein DinB
MQPEQAHGIAQFLLSVIDREHPTTRNVLAAVPHDKGDYKPDPKSKSAIDLAWHIASAEWFFARIAIDAALPSGEGNRPEHVKTSADVVKFYDETVAPVKAELKNLTPEQLVRTIDFHGMFTLPAVVYLNLLQNHTIHHRGQLSAYLRPMGAKVPSIYGPSGDEEVQPAAANA